jgi:crotonobetainyl-CoA:carnitine CoA-transferase CaiB-like acyl-CoA transferase
MVLAMQGPEGENLRVAGNPIKFSFEREQDHRYPPELGKDNRAILTELLGLSHERIDTLEQAGILGSS